MTELVIARSAGDEAISISPASAAGASSDRERRSAAARTDRLRVVELEPGAGGAHHVVDAGAVEVARRHRVDVHLQVLDLVDEVVRPRLVGEVERGLEAAAAAADDGDAQA